MNDENRKRCRFCMKTSSDNDLNLIGDVTKQMLDGLHLKLKLDVGKLILICHECASKLQNAVDFKTDCLNSERTMVRFLNSEENAKFISITSEDKPICHFCRMLTESGCYTYLNGKKEHVFLIEMLKKYIPELYHLTKEIISCKSCLASLQNLSNFIRDCLDTEEKYIMNMASRTNMESQRTLNDIQNFAVKRQVICHDDNIVKVEEKCDQEGIIIKSEEMDIDENEALIELDKPKLHMKNKELVVKLEQMDLQRFVDCAVLPQPEVTTRLCKKRRYLLSNLEGNLSCIKHTSTNKNATKVKLKSNLKEHLLVHKDPSEVEIYKCDSCSFQTKLKGTLKRHLLVHKDPSEVGIYKCDSCSYQAKRKDRLKEHLMVHKDPSEITMYNCDSCSFQSKRNKLLNEERD